LRKRHCCRPGKGVRLAAEHTSNATEVDSWKEVLEVEIEDPTPLGMAVSIRPNAATAGEPMNRSLRPVNSLKHLVELALHNLQGARWCADNAVAAVALAD
jgi:hypothetical protein